MKIERITSNDSFCCSRKCKYSYTLLSMNTAMPLQTVQRINNILIEILFSKDIHYNIPTNYDDIQG